MALEPESPTLERPVDPEEHSMRRRLWVSAVLSAPFIALMVAESASYHLASAQTMAWLSFLLATPVVLWGAWPFFVRAAASVRMRSPNMFTLIGLGVATAYLYSVVAVVAPDLFPHAVRHDGLVPTYFEAAAIITTLVLVGQVLELAARRRTGNALRSLLDLSPETARRVKADGDEEIPVSHVHVGDVLRVRSHDKLPVDGVVLEGHSVVDESLVTGESLPIAKGPGDNLIGATQNGDGTFTMRALAVGSATVLSRIVHLVAQAQRTRAPLQRVADRVSAWFVPAVVAAAAASFLAWLIWGPSPRLAYALVASVSVLIIACPCALGLATPMSIVVATGKAARAGVLFRDAAALERLRDVDTLIVDKTGTLTEGRPRVVEVYAPGSSEVEVVALAAALDRSSEHPLARAVLDEARRRRELAAVAPQMPVTDFRSVQGKGVVGTIGGEKVLVGSAAWLAAEGVDVEALSTGALQRRSSGATVVFVAKGGRALGWLAIVDPIKPDAAQTLRHLREDGLQVVLLTGDHASTAQAVARQLDLTEVHAQVSPQQKAEWVARLQAEGRVVAMAGDGVNDAPALAAADVGIAMGTGTDVAKSTAPVTLVGGDLRGLVRARRVSKATVRNIRQNLSFAFGYNALGVPIAAGVLFPVFGLLLSPMIAAAAMSLSSVSVIGNALRLSRLRLE